MMGLPQQRNASYCSVPSVVKLVFLGLTMFAITAAAARTPDGFQQLSTAADRAREQNRDDEAIQLYRRALALKPDSAETLWALSTLLYAKDQFVPARDTLRIFVALRPDSGSAWAVLGLCEFKLREYSRALDHLQRAMLSGMDDDKLKSAVIYSLATLLTRFEHYDDSMGALFPMVSTNQCEGPTIDAEGLAGLRLPLLPAEIPQDRHDLVRLAGQGLCALQQGRVDDALKSFTSMRDTYPNEPGVHFLLGSFLLNARADDGIAELKRELEISPSHVPAHNRLAEQYTKTGQLDEALKLARESQRLDPKSFSVNIILGEALLAKGETAEAIKPLETAKERAPDNVRIRWDLARAYAAVGRTEDAKREKQQLEKLNQQNGMPDAKPE